MELRNASRKWAIEMYPHCSAIEDIGNEVSERSRFATSTRAFVSSSSIEWPVARRKRISAFRREHGKSATTSLGERRTPSGFQMRSSALATHASLRMNRLVEPRLTIPDMANTVVCGTLPRPLSLRARSLAARRPPWRKSGRMLDNVGLVLSQSSLLSSTPMTATSFGTVIPFRLQTERIVAARESLAANSPHGLGRYPSQACSRSLSLPPGLTSIAESGLPFMRRMDANASARRRLQLRPLVPTNAKFSSPSAISSRPAASPAATAGFRKRRTEDGEVIALAPARREDQFSRFRAANAKRGGDLAPCRFEQFLGSVPRRVKRGRVPVKFHCFGHCPLCRGRERRGGAVIQINFLHVRSLFSGKQTPAKRRSIRPDARQNALRRQCR